jgi:hypothetical protein
MFGITFPVYIARGTSSLIFMLGLATENRKALHKSTHSPCLDGTWDLKNANNNPLWFSVE